ncbi:MAG: hypothetical protein K8R46_06125 [Pirellulales bacterium]|nr:hypothetical protein [Pirellulales bacterium]
MKVRLQKDYNRIMPGKKHRLTSGMDYRVIGIECDDYRIINDKNDPVLYPSRLFDITDSTEPSDWISKIEDGCRYAYPAELNEVGFWEDYHDNVPTVVDVFHKYMAGLCGNGRYE